MKVRELRQFLFNKPDDEEVNVQYVICYIDKGIKVDIRGNSTDVYKTYCNDKECILSFMPRLKYNCAEDMRL